MMVMWVAERVGRWRGSWTWPWTGTEFYQSAHSYKLRNFFWPHSINENNDQNILNLELMLFDLKNKASSRQLPVTNFLVIKW